MVTFSRRQLIDPDYNSLEDPAGPDRADLEKRYGLGERPIPLDHAAAVRGILVSEGKNAWKWIWDWGLLHDAPPLRCGVLRENREEVRLRSPLCPISQPVNLLADHRVRMPRHRRAAANAPPGHADPAG